MCYERYTVREIPSLDGPLFEVVDGCQGRVVGSPTLWAGDAQGVADRMNFENTYED